MNDPTPILMSPTEPPPPIVDETRRVQPSGNAVRTIAEVTVAAGVVIAGVVYFAAVLQPFFMAMFLFCVLNPTANYLQRYGAPRWLSYSVMFLAVCAGFVWTGRIVYDTARSFADGSNEYTEKMKAMVDQIARWTNQAGPDGRFDWANRGVLDLLNLHPNEVLNTMFGSTMQFAEAAFMILFYLFFMIIDSHRLPHRVQAALPAKASTHVLDVGRTIATGIQQYMVVKTFVSLGLGLTSGVVMWMFGVDYWPLWAFVIFAANYITYLGSFIALGPPTVLAVLQFSLPVAIAFGVVLFVVRLFWIDFVEIKFAGRQLNISAVLQLLALMFGGAMWGVVGLLLAVPLLTALKIVLANFEKTKPFAVLMSEE
ncbi:MAG TPA: AI-2E family transporter [Pirellulales bacterium]